MVNKIEFKCEKCNSITISEEGYWIRCSNPKCKDNSSYKFIKIIKD